MNRTEKKLLLIAVSATLAAILQLNPVWYIYFRPEMLNEPWRFLSAHWVHVGWIHYFLNLMAFACFPFIFPKIRSLFIIPFIFFIPILTSLIFYYFYPHVEAYAGFSGVLHGLYAAAALISWQYRRERVFAAIILIGLIVKLIWEATMGELSTTMQLIGSPVLIEAHQMGVLTGLFVLIILYICNKKYKWNLWDG